eukprot:CAMPEP_0118722276 /NCGR_PEP_ID=MMETSP0800-20121206/31265_1 /TAXON_ID=210618 ORGANISM="Striatella unipunctata, Strain CCMP2910" /NCGR_SAMPLE_ID=MMETSP0800 /ASSEMBLY_ACC=CAM_ASM_000638 /LENGTH=52 /DNA_ID=CAMNT_0006630387 /DNA_START=21 /DNA_END=175 /DNA_ORIENTATION=-
MNNKAIVEMDKHTGRMVPSKFRIIVMPEWRGMETVYSSLEGERAIVSKLYRR